MMGKRVLQFGGITAASRWDDMHIAIWIFTFIGLALWSLLAWGLHALLSIDPQWLDNVEALVKNVPYADVIERWFPGWEQLLSVATDLAQTVLGWVGSNAPLVAWIVWGIGALMLLSMGGVLSLFVCLVSEKEAAPRTPGLST
jgi:hypothetical protein